MHSRIQIRTIDRQHSKDINISNEPFPLCGRMIPVYINEKWDYTTERFAEEAEICFPDENYTFDDTAGSRVYIGAYDADKCIGLAIMQQALFKYMYLYDLKVNKRYRLMGVAKALIEKAKTVAKECGYDGIYTQGQDNNLGACLFYLKTGFVIGGLDTKVYQGTPQEGKKDIYFYLDFPED